MDIGRSAWMLVYHFGNAPPTTHRPLRQRLPALHLSDAGAHMAGLAGQSGAGRDQRPTLGANRAHSRAGRPTGGDPLHHPSRRDAPRGACDPIPLYAAAAGGAAGAFPVDPRCDLGRRENLYVDQQKQTVFQQDLRVQRRLRNSSGAEARSREIAVVRPTRYSAMTLILMN